MTPSGGLRAVKGGTSAERVQRFAASSFGRRKSFSSWTASAAAQSGSSLGYDSETMVDPYRQEPWIFACVNRIAEALGAVERLKLYRKVAGADDEEVTEHPILSLLHDVNPLDSFADHQDELGRNLSVAGEHFIFLTDEHGEPISLEEDPNAPIPEPVALWPMMGGENRVRLVCNETTGFIRGWETQGVKTSRFWPASSVLLIKKRRPGSRYRGMGPLGAAFGMAAQLYVAQRYQDGLLRSGGDPGGWIESPEPLGPTEYERLQDEVEENWNNPDRAGEVRLLEGGAKYHPNPLKPRDMAYERLLVANRKGISVTFGVPDALLGMGTSNFATFEGELRVFWTLTIIPTLRLAENVWNERFLKRLPGTEGLYVKYDLSEIEALQGNLEAQGKQARALQEIGVPLNTALRQAGVKMEPIPGGDVPLIRAGQQSLEDVANGVEPPASAPMGASATVPEVKAAPAAEVRGDAPAQYETREEREAAWKVVQAPLDKVEDRVTHKLRRTFDRMKRETVKRIRASAAKGQKPEKAVPGARNRAITEADIDELIAALDRRFVNELADTLENGLGASIKVADKIVLEELSAGGFVATGDPALVVNMRDKAILVSEGSASTTAGQVRHAIIKALGNSLQDIGSLQDALLERLDSVIRETGLAFNMSTRRARTIARTEIGQVASEVRDVRMRQAEQEGIVAGRVWSTAIPASAAPPLEDGGFVRSQHWQMDGKRRLAGQAWTMPDGTVMTRPRDYGAPAHQVVNCKCHELPVFSEDLNTVFEGES